MRLLSTIAGFAALVSLLSAPAAAFEEDPNAIRIPLIQHRSESTTNPDGSFNLALMDQEVQATVAQFQPRNLKANGLTAAGLRVRELADEGYSKEETTKAVTKKMLKARGTNTLYFSSPYTYSIATRIGTPAQLFNLLINTASSDLIVADSTCTNCGGKRLYQNRTSSTSVDMKFQVSSHFGTGTSGLGTVTKDTFLIAKSRINNQTFLRAQVLTSGLAMAPVDGMGMAYAALSDAGATSIPFTAQAQGSGNYFMLRLSSTQGFSELSLGSIDKTRIGKTALTFPVLQDTTQSQKPQFTFWQIGSSSPNVNGKAVLTTRATFILTSGSGLIYGPPGDVAKFYAKIAGSSKLPHNDNYYIYPCAQEPTVSFSFGTSKVATNNFAITAADFNLGTYASAMCVGAVVTADLGLGSRWLIGTVFMRNWVIVHDMSQNAITIASPVDVVKGTPGSKL